MMLKLTQNYKKQKKKKRKEKLNGSTGDNARADLRAQGVWRQVENVFFDIRLTNTKTGSQKHLPVSAILKNHQKEKKRPYNN